jgi:hypothetical protein
MLTKGSGHRDKAAWTVRRPSRSCRKVDERFLATYIEHYSEMPAFTQKFAEDGFRRRCTTIVRHGMPVAQVVGKSMEPGGAGYSGWLPLPLRRISPLPHLWWPSVD